MTMAKPLNLSKSHILTIDNHGKMVAGWQWWLQDGNNGWLAMMAADWQWWLGGNDGCRIAMVAGWQSWWLGCNGECQCMMGVSWLTMLDYCRGWNAGWVAMLHGWLYNEMTIHSNASAAKNRVGCQWCQKHNWSDMLLDITCAYVYMFDERDFELIFLAYLYLLGQWFRWDFNWRSCAVKVWWIRTYILPVGF